MYLSSGCQRTKDVAFVLDTSASVGQENYKLMVKFVTDLVTHLTKDEQDNKFSYIRYSTEVR